MTSALRRPIRFGLLGVLAMLGFALLAPREPEAAHPASAVAAETVAQAEGQSPVTQIVRQGLAAAKADPNDLTKSDSGWEIEWDLTDPDNRPHMPPGVTMRIRSAKFMWKDKGGKPQWITVARMLELGEIYVPYDNGYTAFMDVHHHPFYTTPAR